MIFQLNEQKSEAESLRGKVAEANTELQLKNAASAAKLTSLLEGERKVAAEERETLLVQIGGLINSNSQKSEQRLRASMHSVQTEFKDQHTIHGLAQQVFTSGSEKWSLKAKDLVGSVTTSRDELKNKMRTDFAAANECTASLRSVTTSVHAATTRIVDEQVTHLDQELSALDGIVAKVKDQNNSHHILHIHTLQNLGSTVQTSYDNISTHFENSFSRIEGLDSAMATRTTALRDNLSLLDSDKDLRTRLRTLRNDIDTRTLEDYSITGQTPAKRQYDLPATLPRTESHQLLLSKLREQTGASDVNAQTPSHEEEQHAIIPQASPSKALVFTDAPSNASDDSATSARCTSGLRELDPNTTYTPAMAFHAGEDADIVAMPSLKRLHTTGSDFKPAKRRGVSRSATSLREERENAPPKLGASVGASTMNPTGRRGGLRSQGNT